MKECHKDHSDKIKMNSRVFLLQYKKETEFDLKASYITLEKEGSSQDGIQTIRN